MAWSERGLGVYLAYRVRLARARAGLSQGDVARAVFGAPEYAVWVDQIERAHRQVTAFEVYRLALVLRVEVGFFFPSGTRGGEAHAQA